MSRHLALLLLLGLLRATLLGDQLSGLKKNQIIADFQVSNLYADGDGRIIGVGLKHIRSGAPTVVLQFETVPQVLTWVDTPATSNKGLAHALEHLLVGKGTKGRYLHLLCDMRLSQTEAATPIGYNLYGLSSGSGLSGFYETFHALLDALFHPDFTDLEAEREFYHFAVSVNASGKKSLVENGTVYEEMQAKEDIYDYYFNSNRAILGANNPFSFYSGGIASEMRSVTPQEIRRFHSEHYRLGPGTGFIFALPSNENILRFLKHVSSELKWLGSPGGSIQREHPHLEGQPKYPIESDPRADAGIDPFPSTSDQDRGRLRFAWKPQQAATGEEVTLLELLFHALGQGQQSMLYKELIGSETRSLDSNATGVETEIFLGNSAAFPVPSIELTGVSGGSISIPAIEQLNKAILEKIKNIATFPDRSSELEAFNKEVSLDIQSSKRTERMFAKNAPQFGSDYKTDWKDRLEFLEMDPGFIRSVSDEEIWKHIEDQLRAGTNVWATTIKHFHLLDQPVAEASVPSAKRLAENEAGRVKRIEEKESVLKRLFGTSDEQEALARFEQQEKEKTKKIEKIADSVRRPRFTDQPPLTPDDEIRYKQYRLSDVPVIATFFSGAPTIDIGLSFDLRKIPIKYYKYLSVFPRCVDSLGLRNPAISYSELVARTQAEIPAFSIKYNSNPVVRRADLTIRASATTPDELGSALSLIQQLIRRTNLDGSNVDRLRDVVKKRIESQESFTRDPFTDWYKNPAYALRYEDDALYQAVESYFARAHWDGRLQWLLHPPVKETQLEKLRVFSEDFLSTTSDLSPKALSERLEGADLSGLEAELIHYWERNIHAFSPDDLRTGLRLLTREVLDDIRRGPGKTITELQELAKLVLNREALRVDVTLDKALLTRIEPKLKDFFASIPGRPEKPEGNQDHAFEGSVAANLEKRFHVSEDEYPLYVALEDPISTTGGLIVYSDFPGYDETKRSSLIRMLASKLLSGNGPQSIFMRSWEQGLAYNSGLISSPAFELLWYEGDRVADIPAFVELVNSAAAKAPELKDPTLVDYALQQMFPTPRSLGSFAERGRELAQDIYDGNDPGRVRRFSKAVLKLRKEPDLLSELRQVGTDAISGVLLRNDMQAHQRTTRSLFFFYGPDRLLSDVERRLAIPKLLRVYPSDFWIDDGHAELMSAE